MGEREREKGVGVREREKRVEEREERKMQEIRTFVVKMEIFKVSSNNREIDID